MLLFERGVKSLLRCYHMHKDTHPFTHRDPFNRKPLTVEELVPNTELKQRIDAWRAEQRTKRQNQPTPMERG